MIENLPDKIRTKIFVAPGGCWLWTGSCTWDGYAITSKSGKTRYVHRIVYEALRGDIPYGFEVDHLCKVTGCVNPDHLEPVTHRENLMRSSNFSALRAAQTHCINGHEFTPENTYYWAKRPNLRHCRTCRAIHNHNKKDTRPRVKRYVTVCDKCLRASCWLGLFMCDEAQTAGLTVISHVRAARLRREHRDYYTHPDVQAEKSTTDPVPTVRGTRYDSQIVKVLE